MMLRISLNVATPENIRSRVSSQLMLIDLTTMQRDRLMTGTQTRCIDFAWLLANIEVAKSHTVLTMTSIPRAVETFVIGSQGASALPEELRLGLFQLYRRSISQSNAGIEKLFNRNSDQAIRKLIRIKRRDQDGLPEPIIRDTI